jgi:hypothetical protein
LFQEQLIASDEENAGLRSERAELHSLLNDTALELDQKKKDLADAEGENRLHCAHMPATP